MRLGLVSIVLALALTVFAASGPNVNSVVTHLGRFQGESGGFYPAPGYPENLQDTSYALFLSSLFGSHSRIDTNRVHQFLEKLSNADHGYANQAGGSSDLESVRNALLAYASLGISAPDAEEVAAYLHASFDSSSNLFAPTRGGSGDLKSTAAALESFALLQLESTKEVLDKHAAVKKGLATVFKSEGGKKFFSSLTSDNYYGIAVAKRVGYNFGDADSWARYFQERQAQNGGFFADADRSEVAVADTAHAILALYELDESLPNTVNLHALVDFVNNLPGSLKHAALAYQALARTQAFQEIFRVETAFSNAKHISWASQNIFVQGAIVKPLLSVRTAFGLSQAGLRIAVTITHDGKSQSTNLHWDAERELYHTPETFDTTGLFGDLKYSFAITWDVPELPGLSRVHDVTKPISYWTNIHPTTTFAGKAVALNGAVGIGAQFSFDLTMGTVADPPKKSIKTGDFKVTFSVLDSSSLIIYKDSLDGKTNSDTINFEYTLQDTNLPAGLIYFAFEIESGGFIHTRDAVSYSLSVPMVATEINFIEKKEKYEIGDTVEISMAPATLPDLRTVQHYTTGPRQFFLQVTAPGSSTVLNQIRGDCKVEKYLKCSFDIPIEATFTSLGEQVITFYYRQANGQTLPLTNYDSNSKELYEEGQSVEYFVDSLLQVVGDTNKPKSGQLVYGNKIQFTFKVQDTVSGETVWDNDRSRSVFLALRHEKGKSTQFTSDLSPIEVSHKDGQKQYYSVDWTVNPNAVKGPSSLELVVVTGNQKETPISSGTGAWAVEVEIGGKIHVEQKSYSIVLESDETAFFVDFDLSCEKAPLQDALLFANIVFEDRAGPKVVTQQPVVMGQNGKYQVSWSLLESKAPSGTYKVNVFRAVDQRRFGDAAEPFFTTTLVHSPPLSSPLPFKTEFVVTCLLVAAFFFASLKKMEIEGTNNPKKK